MVNSVEFVVFHQSKQMRELQRKDSFGLSAGSSDPPQNRSGPGTWARTLLPTTRSAMRPSAASSFATCVPKKRTRVGTPFSTAALATFAAGSIPSTGISGARSTAAGSRRCWPPRPQNCAYQGQNAPFISLQYFSQCFSHESEYEAK